MLYMESLFLYFMLPSTFQPINSAVEDVSFIFVPLHCPNLCSLHFIALPNVATYKGSTVNRHKVGVCFICWHLDNQQNWSKFDTLSD